MPLTSPISRLPYPVLSDPANIETAVRPLVEALDPKMTPGASEVATVRTLGTEARSAARGNDTRLSDERIPTNESVSVAKTGTGTAGLAHGSFRAYRTTAQSIPTGGAVVVFPTEHFDVSRWYDAASGRFTPQERGIYRISAMAFPASLTAGAPYELFVRKNGAGYARLMSGYGTGSPMPGEVTAGSTLVELNGSTDYVDIYLQHVEGTARNTSAGQFDTWVCGEMVGRT